MEQEVSPEHDGGHSVDGEEEPDDEGVAVEQHSAVLQDGRQSGDRNGELDEAGDEPSHPVDGVVQTHHLHHLTGGMRVSVFCSCTSGGFGHSVAVGAFLLFIN